MENKKATSEKIQIARYLNHTLLSLVCGIGLILVLVVLTEIASSVLTVIGLIVTLMVFLFPGIKKLNQATWFLNRSITIGLSVILIIQIIYLVFASFKPGEILLRVIRIEGQAEICGAYCTVVLEGKGIHNLEAGENLLVYSPQARLVNGNWSEAPIALIRVVGLYVDTAVAQVVLIHEKAEVDETRQIMPGLRVGVDNEYNSEFLIPTYGDGYVYQNLTIYLHPNSEVSVGDRLVIIAPQLKGERIVDFQTTDTELRIVSIGQNRVSAQTELISGVAPVPGDLVVNKFEQGIPLFPFEPKVVLIPGSIYEIGHDSSNADESPVHIQTIPDFYVALTEVTNSQYRPFIDDGGYYERKYWTEDGWAWVSVNMITQPKYWNDPLFYGEVYPVVGVSWYEAMAYVNWLSIKTGRHYRLLTEVEWERVACGYPKMDYPWGNVWYPGNANFADKSLLRQEPSFTWADDSYDDGYIYTAPVGSYPAGLAAEGVLDLAGNVWEWTSSLYQDYPYVPSDGREDPSSSGIRVTRGGGWGSEAKNLKCTTRGPQPQDYQTFIIGFRLGREP